MQISFVVPTRNSGRTLAACLGSLRSQTHPEVEIVVVDNGSTDATVAIGERFADQVLQWGPERSAQRNHGTKCSTGDVVVFIDSDMVMEPTLAASLVAAFEAEPGVGALVIPERSFGDGFLAHCRELEKSLYVGDPAVESPRAFRRELIEELGGWDENLTAAEDWDLADRTRAVATVGRVASYIWHDEGHIKLRATFAKKRYYGRWIDQYVSMHADSNTKFARTALIRRPGALLRHPVLTAGLVALKATEAAGLLLGVRDSRSSSAAPGLPGGRTSAVS
ncbi:glycosyltransferase family A protein [Actinoplanes sp. N902-109]|uniref:glycosyltransferase family 2 protein n=1 Tax=Actinoplanes sp. (strain N902-109) TaxID=649831 RepID=UPI0003294467|nr:glycosyltransferase family A protein [Actinoplanes sp. N902-109]AGL14305.1 glycosyltransferase, group 2 family protein [Actinoplanes sp. N902-109]